MPVLERDIEAHVVSLWREKGFMTTKLAGQGHRGKLDRIFWIPGGRPAIIEFKRPGEEPTPVQMYFLRRLEKQGYRTAWFDDAGLAFNFLMALVP